MESKEDREIHQHNLMYYNQMVEKGTLKRSAPDKKKKKAPPTSFAKQNIELSDYLIAPEGYEAVVYPLYFLLVPYITGALFLFLFVAGGSFENFKLLEVNAFLIVWMIGYEIVGSCILIAIFIAFLKYDDR